MNETRAELEEQYRQAIYVVIAGTGEIRFHVGECSPKIDALLAAHNAETFAFITAHNPRSKMLTHSENEARQSSLRKTLRAENRDFLEGYGTDEREIWERENSFFIFDIAQENAVEIGRKYEQNAIVWGAKSEKTELVWCWKMEK